MADFVLTSGLITHLGSGSVISGSIASGQVGSMHLSSGIDLPGMLVFNMPAGEMLSGAVLVAITRSGTLLRADPNVSTLRPAAGFVPGNFQSGDVTPVFTNGVFALTSGLGFRWSGLVGRQLLAGSGGFPVTLSGFPGGLRQWVGLVLSGDSLIVQMNPFQSTNVAP